MAYSNFTTIQQIREELKIISISEELFVQRKQLEPSAWLKETLSYSKLMRSTNEKTKSETIVAPILTELIKRNKDFATIYSGTDLNVDTARGLNGECDFIISKDIKSYDLNNPILQIIEAKDHDMKLGIPQCAAQMYASKLFNEKKNENIDCIYGCVTTGEIWQFMKLCEEELFVDTQKYYLNEVDKILGVFQTIIDYYK